MQENEAWLMYKDPKNKRIKAHIKFDIKCYTESHVSNIMQFINQSIGYIDDKYFSMLKRNIEYNLAGLEELDTNKEDDILKIERLLYSLENKIPELIEFVNKTLNYAAVDIRMLKNVVYGIVSLFQVLGKNSAINYSTNNQKLLLVNNFMEMLRNYNNKIDWQIQNATQTCFFQNASLPPWFALNNTINTNSYIKQIGSEKILIETKKAEAHESINFYGVADM